MITTKNGNVVMMSEADWEEILETIYLIGNPDFEKDVEKRMNTPMSKREA